jgi:hypothetical protein
MSETATALQRKMSHQKSKKSSKCAIYYPTDFGLINNFDHVFVNEPITVAARPKEWNIFTCSNIGIMGSNPTQGMDVYVRLFCVYVVLCVGSGLATGWSSIQGVLPSV